jgi:hypothetical protein
MIHDRDTTVKVLIGVRRAVIPIPAGPVPDGSPRLSHGVTGAIAAPWSRGAEGTQTVPGAEPDNPAEAGQATASASHGPANSDKIMPQRQELDAAMVVMHNAPGVFRSATEGERARSCATDRRRDPTPRRSTC